jgi:hypothetical protein
MIILVDYSFYVKGEDLGPFFIFLPLFYILFYISNIFAIFIFSNYNYIVIKTN